MKVTAILKGKADRNGLQKVYIRINNGEARNFKATSIKVREQDWNKDKGLVKYSHPQASLYNAVIKKLLIQTEAAVVGDRYEAKKDADFFRYVATCMDEWAYNKRPGYLRQMKAQEGKIRAYNPSFKLSEVNHGFLKGLQAHLYNLGNVQNTVWGCFKFLRLVLRKAQREGLLDRNPMETFDKPKYRNPSKVYLTRDELELIDKFARFTDSKELAFSANWFLIGCYTGLRFGDLRFFDREKHVQAGRIVVHTTKTNKVVSMPMSNRLQVLFGRVGDRPLKIHNEVYNRNLKVIQAGAGITKKLTAHISRHTFATLCASAGISIEVTAELLGHSNVRETAIYYKITNPRIDTELKKLE